MDWRIYSDHRDEWVDAENAAFLRKRDPFATEYRYPGERYWEAAYGRTWIEKAKDGNGNWIGGYDWLQG